MTGGAVAFATRENADLILWGIGGLAAVLSLYLLIRNTWPPFAKVLAWPVRACGFVLVVVLVRGPRWTWRQAWRNEHGISRGPLVRCGARARGWVVAALEPQFVLVRHSAREQHDEQNLKLAEVDGKLENIDGRLTAIEELVTAPRLRRSTTTTVEEVTPPRSQHRKVDK